MATALELGPEGWKSYIEAQSMRGQGETGVALSPFEREQLSDRIQGELADLETNVHRAIKSWTLAQKVDEVQDVYLDSVALNLHGLYSAAERLLELIVRNVDRSVLDGTAWHRDLLEQISKDVPGVRPAVISKDTS